MPIYFPTLRRNSLFAKSFQQLIYYIIGTVAHDNLCAQNT